MAVVFSSLRLAGACVCLSSGFTTKTATALQFARRKEEDEAEESIKERQVEDGSFVEKLTAQEGNLNPMCMRIVSGKDEDKPFCSLGITDMGTFDMYLNCKKSDSAENCLADINSYLQCKKKIEEIDSREPADDTFCEDKELKEFKEFHLPDLANRYVACRKPADDVGATGSVDMSRETVSHDAAACKKQALCGAMSQEVGDPDAENEAADLDNCQVNDELDLHAYMECRNGGKGRSPGECKNVPSLLPFELNNPRQTDLTPVPNLQLSQLGDAAVSELVRYEEDSQEASKTAINNLLAAVHDLDTVRVAEVKNSKSLIEFMKKALSDVRKYIETVRGVATGPFANSVMPGTTGAPAARAAPKSTDTLPPAEE